MGRDPVIYDGDKLSYTLRIIDKGVHINFEKDGNSYDVEIEQVKIGHTSMTDYFKFGDVLTYNEFTELEGLINRLNYRVSDCTDIN